MSNRMYSIGYDDAIRGAKARYFGPSYQAGYSHARWFTLAKDILGGVAMLAASFITGVALAFWLAGLETYS